MCTPPTDNLLFSFNEFIIGDDQTALLNEPSLTEAQQQIAELGKPRIGEHTKCQITIKQSREFQVRARSVK